MWFGLTSLFINSVSVYKHEQRILENKVGHLMYLLKTRNHSDVGSMPHSEAHPFSAHNLSVLPRNFLVWIALGQRPVGGDKADTDTSLPLHLLVNLKLQITLIIPCFHFLTCAPLFSGHHTAPVTQEELECLGKSPEKAQATIFSLSLANPGSSLERSVTRSVCYLCVVGWPCLDNRYPPSHSISPPSQLNSREKIRRKILKLR